jgi:enamine deaminase RidA (YjgF/YER057c/UK114 family)
MNRMQPVVPAARTAESQRWKFSQAVLVAGFLLCSGQIGNLPDGSIPADPREQFERAFENIDAVLAEAGFSRQHVVDMTTFHVGLPDHLRTFGAVRERWLGDVRPAWTSLGVAALASPHALAEIKVTAWKGAPA